MFAWPLLIVALLTACTTPQSPTPDPAPTATAEPSPTEPSAPASEDNTTVLQQEAIQVIRDYYSAINRGDYSAAYAMWQGDGMARQQSLEQFEQGFADTSSVAVDVGDPGEIEGAVGSLFIEIPVTVTAVMTNGRPQRFIGSYSLRRVNDVPGATPEQLQWHLQSANIAQVN